MPKEITNKVAWLDDVPDDGEVELNDGLGKDSVSMLCPTRLTYLFSIIIILLICPWLLVVLCTGLFF